MSGRTKRLGRRLLWLPLVLVLAACASSSPYEGMTSNELLGYAERMYEEEDWDDAVEALELFVSRYPVHDRLGDARWMLAHALQENEEYLQAAAEFDRFVGTFPQDPRVPEAALEVCRSYAALAPIPPRDQRYTRQARDRCQLVARDFPGTEVEEQALAVRDEMMDRLAEKDFRAGEQYQRFGAHDSALIYFEEVLDRFPDSRWAPKALVAKYESYRAIGYDEEAEEARDRLLAEFPDSPEAGQFAERADG